VIEETTTILQAARVLTYSSLAFLMALWLAPSFINLLVWLKFWKKRSRTVDSSGGELVVTKKFYEENEEKRKIPRAGGLLIWVTAIVFAVFFWLVFKIEVNETTQFLNFVSRAETFIPIGTLFFASMFGFVDDALATMENGGNYFAGGLKLSQRLLLVTVLSIAIGLWFFFKLNITRFTVPGGIIDLTNIQIPYLFTFSAPWLIIPITVVVLLAMWGGSVIDGFDGLAAGVFIPLYLCFAALSFTDGFYNIATFLMVVTGAMTAYLWYNIPPAKFYMGDTGSIGLLLTIGVVAFLIDKIYVLSIAGFILFLTEFSNIVQIFSKKVFKRKFFLAAPLHHHFEAKGWLRHQVTMRYWLISIITSILGLAMGLLIG
jgi:phospho-N-acetylmuramoyl-pentapeptide-transferase